MFQYQCSTPVLHARGATTPALASSAALVRFKSRDGDHAQTRARAVSATPTSSDGASANRSKRRKVVIEQEARRRAVDGYDHPVFQGGKLAGVVRVYSDQLAAMLLRGRRRRGRGSRR
jgi:hypothetical protein